MKTLKIAMFALAAAGLLNAPALDARERPSGEEKLAKLLKGRVAGEPESCIRTFPHTRLTVIDGTALVYKQGSTLWVNRTRYPSDIDDDDALVSRQFGAQLCRTDIVTTIDRNAQFYTGNIFLGDFVPYRRPD